MTYITNKNKDGSFQTYLFNCNDLNLFSNVYFHINYVEYVPLPLSIHNRKIRRNDNALV